MSGGMLSHSLYLSVRRLRALWRQPYFVAITLVQPIIWLLLFGQLFKRIVEIPGFTSSSYISFLTPGVVVMTALFSSGWSGMALITDMERGVMDRFLVSPAWRGSLIMGGLGYQAAVTVLQSLIVIGIGLAAGADFPGGPATIVLLILASVLLGFTFGSFSDAIALLLRREDSVIAAVNFLALPLTFLSSTFMPQSLVPGWIQSVARYNPVNWAVEIGRETLNAQPDWSLVLSRTGYLVAVAIALIWTSIRAFRAYQRSI